MSIMLRLFLFALVALSGCRSSTIEQLIAKAAEQLLIPGVAVGIVNAKGEVLLRTCFGRQNANTEELVTPRTLFRIGSTSKSFTSLMIARLVEHEVLNWDSKIIDYLPFELDDSKLASELTFRQALSMTSGLPVIGSALLLSQAETANDRIEELKLIKPTADIGERFQYSNHAFSLAGYAAAKSSYPDLYLEQAFKQAMNDFVFCSLCMTDSTTEISGADPKLVAQPHALNLEGKPVSMKDEVESWLESIQPAGSILSNLNDMLNFVAFQLASTSAEVNERYRKEIRFNSKKFYGLGVGIREDERFGEVLGHGGGTTGFTTSFSLVRRHGLGIVILTNRHETDSFISLINELFFRAFILQESDVSVWFKDALTKATHNQTTEVDRLKRSLINATECPFDLDQTFLNERIGAASFEQTGGVCEIRFKTFSSTFAQSEEDPNVYVLTGPWAMHQDIEIQAVNEREFLLVDPQETYYFRIVLTGQRKC